MFCRFIISSTNWVISVGWAPETASNLWKISLQQFAELHSAS